MLTISLIVAASTNNAIGKENKLLWHLPNDMKYFKATTWAMPIIMGRKTFESMGSKPLSGRLNIVITRDENWKAAGVVTATSIKASIEVAKQSNCKELFIAGGGEIYKQSMEIADCIYMTRVHTIIDGDTFFPEIDTNLWQLATTEEIQKDEKHSHSYSFEKWIKK
jgi:dihydrofolate reductase